MRLNLTVVLALASLAFGCANDSAEFKPTDDGTPPPSAAPATVATAEAKVPTIVSFTATPPTVEAGATTMLKYSVIDAESVTVSIQGGLTLVPATNTLEFEFATPPLSTATTFLLTATNKDKQSVLPLVVMVNAPVAPAIPTDAAAPLHASIEAFDVSSRDIQVGESATLSWATTNAAQGTLLANDVEMLEVATATLPQGMQVVSPGATTIYTLIMVGQDGQEVTAVTSINVAVGGAVLSARELFDRNVAQVLDLRCGFCHAGANVVDGPDFLGSARATYYDQLIADARMVPARPDDSLLLLKGEHTGPAFTQVEAQTVTAWLLKEADERGPDEPEMPGLPPRDYTPRTVSDALTRFGDCMVRAEWDATYGVSEDTMVAYQNTTEGRCYACHATGTAGAFLAQSSGDTFDQSQIRPNVLKLVLPTANEDGSFKTLVSAYRFRDKGGDQGHPSYQLSAERSDAINTFVDSTLERFSDYTQPCPPVAAVAAALP